MRDSKICIAEIPAQVLSILNQYDVTPMKNISNAAFCGLSAGMVLGHCDLLVRVVSKNYAWFEIYQALLLPALIFAVLFLIVALVREVILKKLQSKESTHAPYGFFALILVLLLLVVLLANYIFYGDLVLWDPERVTVNAGCLFLVVLISILVMQHGKERINSLSSSWIMTGLSKIWANYLFFICVVVFVSWLYDLYLIKSIPNQSAASAQNKPNVLLVVLDTVRADHLSSWGYDKETSPNLDVLAKKSALFKNVTSVSSWTLPAHASMFTGNFIFKHGAHENHQKLDDTQVTLAEIFREKGYATAGFIGGPYCKAKYGVGQGFEYYNDRLDFFEYQHTEDLLSVRRMLQFFSMEIGKKVLGLDGERTASEINQDVKKWLNKNGRKPYFLFINYFDAHDPYDPPMAYRELFTSDNRDEKALNFLVRDIYFSPEERYKFTTVDDELRKLMVALYDAEIRELDYHFNSLLKYMEDEGYLENTIVVITSDHGEEFLEHGGTLHKQTLYTEVLEVPLLVYYPQMIRPQLIRTRVSNIDIFPTILSLAGIDVPEGIDALDLLPLIEGEREFERDYVISQRYAREEHGESYLQAITESEWKLIEVTPERERLRNSLYYIQSDFKEKKNLYSFDRAKQEKIRLSEKLNSIVKNAP